jgi:uncharacterized HAD superfamily protein
VRIGIDLDGVLADFTTSYWRLMAEIQGTLPMPSDFVPGRWHWEQEAGFTANTVTRAWETIGASEDFWKSLSVLPSAQGMDLVSLQEENDLYFITHRRGKDVKYQSERWLQGEFFLEMPTVLIAGDKGPLARGLELDVFIDDRAENIVEVLRHSRRTQCFVVDYPYNRDLGMIGSQVVRVPSIKEVFCGSRLRSGAC